MNKTIYAQRQNRIFRHLENTTYDSFLTADLSNICYLSGFSGSSGYLFFTADKSYFYTDFRYKTQSEEEVYCDKIVILKNNFFLKPPKEIFKIKHLGVEGESISIHNYETLKEALKERIAISVLPNFILENRAEKDAEELKLITKAAEIADNVFASLLDFIKPGITEKELAYEIDLRIKRFADVAFPTIVASGPNSARPHHQPQDKPLKENEPITIDLGVRYFGYNSDMTRTIFIKKVDEEMKRIYAIVYEAQKKALASLKPGLKAKKVDAVARDYIKEKGYGKYFGHGLGHGVGLLVHEKPWLSYLSKDKINKNAVVTVEPGIYLPDKGGVRIEDLVWIKEDENVILSKSPKELTIL